MHMIPVSLHSHQLLSSYAWTNGCQMYFHLWVQQYVLPSGGATICVHQTHKLLYSAHCFTDLYSTHGNCRCLIYLQMQWSRWKRSRRCFTGNYSTGRSTSRALCRNTRSFAPSITNGRFSILLLRPQVCQPKYYYRHRDTFVWKHCSSCIL